MESTYSDRYANLMEDPAMEAYFSQLPGYIQDQIRARKRQPAGKGIHGFAAEHNHLPQRFLAEHLMIRRDAHQKVSPAANRPVFIHSNYQIHLCSLPFHSSFSVS